MMNVPVIFFIRNVVFLQEYIQVIYSFFKELTDHLSKTSKVKVTSKLMPYNNVEWGEENTGNIWKVSLQA